MTIGHLLTAGSLLVLLGLFFLPFLAWDRKREHKHGAQDSDWLEPPRMEEVVYRDTLELRPPYAPKYDPDTHWPDQDL